MFYLKISRNIMTIRLSSTFIQKVLAQNRRCYCSSIKSGSMDSDERTGQQYLRNYVRKAQPTAATQPCAVMQDSELFANPSPNLDEVLDVDVRLLPSQDRLACLESMLRACQSSAHTKVPTSSTTDAWTQFYLWQEHTSCWHDKSLKLDFTGLELLTETKDLSAFMNDPRVQLVVLSTTASANQLPLSRLLDLVRCMLPIWKFFDPKVFASVLRLVTQQINEMSPSLYPFLANVLVRLQDHIQVSGEKCTAETLPAENPLKVEADLLLDALRIHIRSKMARLESLGMVALLHLMYDLRYALTPDEIIALSKTIECSVISNKRQQSLYTLVCGCAVYNRLGVVHRGLVNRWFGQINRKLAIANKHSSADVHQWISTALCAMANFSVGCPPLLLDELNHGDLSLEAFSLPPVWKRELYDHLPSSYPADVDAHELFWVGWIRALLVDLANFLLKAYSKSQPHTGSAENLAQLAYTFALLGFRADNLIDKLRKLPSLDDSSILWLDLVELLIGPCHSNSAEPLVNAVDYLPRVDWQVYYHLALNLNNSNTSTLNDHLVCLMPHYAKMKQEAATFVVDQLKSCFNPAVQLQVLPLQKFRTSERSPIYFADILFVKESVRFPGMVKCVPGFLHWKRDLVVNRPLETLLGAYHSSLGTQCVKIPQRYHLSKSKDLAVWSNVLSEVVDFMTASKGYKSAEFELL